MSQCAIMMNMPFWMKSRFWKDATAQQVDGADRGCGGKSEPRCAIGIGQKPEMVCAPAAQLKAVMQTEPMLDPL
jgi:hypothetical protein